MKWITVTAIIFMVITLSCNKQDIEGLDTYLYYNGWIEEDEYWVGTVNFNQDARIRLDFEVTQGNKVDLLLLDKEGFVEFKNRIGYELVSWTEWIIHVEEFVVCTLWVDTGQCLRFDLWMSMCSTYVPLDVFLVDSIGYAYYLAGNDPYGYVHYIHETMISFNFTPWEPEHLYCIVDNTTLHGSLPEGTAVCELGVCRLIPQAVTCYPEGTALSTDSATLYFNAPTDKTLYVVVNNAGYVLGGAIPRGVTDFHISLEEE